MRKILLVLLAFGLAFEVLLQSSDGKPYSSDKTSSSSDASNDSHLLEIGRAAQLLAGPQSPSEVKVVSYNIRWRSGEDLRKLTELLKTDAEIGGAAILGLQEVDRNKKRSGNNNTVKALAEELGMHYAWAAPPSPKAEREEETGVAILSSYPMTEVRRIVLPHEGPGKKRRVAIGATINTGRVLLRVYSVHSETRLSVKRKIDQMKAVLTDLAHHPRDRPAIVLGDFNTWEWDAADKAEKLFTAGGFHTPFDDGHTFSRRVLFVPIKLKLDWIWLRHLKTNKHGVDRKITLSDHLPLWINLDIKQERSVDSSAGAQTLTRE